VNPSAQLRSRALRGLTRLRRSPHLVRGELTISGGITVGMRLRGRYVPCTHPQAYELVRGSVEPDVQEALRRTIASGAVIWDVGANIGFISLVAARLAGPEGRVYAIEPAPDNAAAVREHAAINDLGGVIDVVEAAAGDSAGPAEFLLVSEPSWSHLAERGHHRLTESAVEVKVVRLDTLVDADQIAPPSVVKIDVEGSEGAVLRGMEQTIATHRPAIICELHKTNDEVMDLLEGAGYRVENLSGPEGVRTAGAVRLLARPNSPP